ncbi:MAG: hypothetical protein ABF649_22930, partial [Bacillus sp. (in: firmicutes)]
DYFENKLTDLKYSIEGRFAFFYQLKDAFGAVTNAISSPKWDGIKATVPFINKELTVVSPDFVNAAAPKIKAFIGGFIVLFLFGYIFRRASVLLGVGK